MKLMAVLLISGCVVKTGSSSTPVAPSTSGGEASASTGGGAPAGGSQSEYSGPDAIWMPDLMHHPKTDAEELLAAKGFKGQIVSTGDTDPQYARDELVCEQNPTFGKMSPTATVTLKYCNTYQKPKEGPNLVGMEIEAAKAKAKEAGFTGEIEVIQASSLAGCASKSVCGVTPELWWLNQDRRMTLTINPY